MMRTDRYILSQMSGYFLFFLLVFTGVIWLNRALRYVDFVLENGQAGAEFALLAVLLLPNVLEMVVPVAGFAASVALTNRLFGESELVVMMGAGIHNAVLMRPFMLFGLACLVVVGVLGHIVAPVSFGKFLDLQHRIRSEYLAQIIVEGEFVFPNETTTFFFGKTAADGALHDIVIRERPEDGPSVVHTAPYGSIGNDSPAPKLLLLDGVIQTFTHGGRTLNTVHFDSLSYDLAPFAKSTRERTGSVQEVPTPELRRLAAAPDGGHLRDSAVAERHSRSVKALIAFLAPVIGVAAILAGGFKRTGAAFRIIVAIALMLAVNSLRGALEAEAARHPDFWWILYAAPAFGSALVLALGWVGVSSWRKTWDSIESGLAPGWSR